MPRRPIPADFQAHAHLRNKELMPRFRVAGPTLARWRAELGIRLGSCRRARPVPADFRDFAPGKSRSEIAERYGVSAKTVARWRKETGVQGYKPERAEAAALSRRAIIPDDFAAVAPTLLLTELCERYGRNRTTIRRWLDRSGVKPRPYRTHAPPPTRAATIRRAPGRPPLTPRQAAPLSGRDEEAAQYLRRFAAVYRCGPKGAADPGGKLWRYGNAILTAAELQGRARRHGWDPDQWRVIAGHPIRRDALPSFPRAGAM